MVAVPVSAFEMYQKKKEKSSKKKASRKKNKNKNKDLIKVTPALTAELMKATTEAENIPVQKKKENKSNAENPIPSFSPVDEPLITLVKGSELKKGTEPSEKPKAKKNKKKKVKTVELMDNNINGASSSKSESAPKCKRPEYISLSRAENSIETAEKFFSWMMDPIGKDDFLSLYWEKRPVHISRDEHRDYYKSLLSTKAIDEMLRKNSILFSKNLDVTSYRDGQRETLNCTGRAHAAVIWDYYRNGCSIRLLNPQTYHPHLRELNTRLQEVFGAFVGANAYLTPPDSQGFAPHYDDIEAFVLQIEGSKKWRVYAPRDTNEKLPRTSSPNFSQDEIGEPILEVIVKAGDLLYFPRGFIHQASTVPGEHSLHVTVSTYQRSSWADLLEKLVPAALVNAIDDDVEFRKGMPLDVMNHIGAVHCDSESASRDAIMKKLKKLFSKLFDYAPVDAAADQLAKEYIHEALPPCLSADEKKCSVLENCEHIVSEGQLQGLVVLTPETHIRLTRSNVLRLVSEEEPDIMKIYHSMENSLEYKGEELQHIEIPLELAPAVEHLIHSYPKFTAVCDLPLDQDSDKVRIATELWERCLVLTREPLSTVE